MKRRPPRAALRTLAACALAAPLLAAATGCSHVPKIIVLEDPLSAEEHVALGVSYERGGELDLAAREYERALRKDRASFRARLNLGNVRLAEGRHDAARGEYLAALALRPADAEATNNLAWAALAAADDLDDALRRLDEALAAGDGRPRDALTPALLDTRGVLLGRLGRRAEADGAFAAAAAACLELRPPGGAVPAPAGSGCPDETLEEIRRHRDELAGRAPAR